VTRVHVLAGLASAVVYAVALVVVGTSDTGVSPVAITIAFLAGASWLVGGLIALVRFPEYRTGWLMLAAGGLWALAALQLSDSSALFTAGAAFGQLAFAPWIQLTMGFPEGRLRNRVDRTLVATTYIALLVFPTVAALFDRTPFPACTGCPDSATIAESSTTVAVARALGALVGISLSVVYIERLLRRYRGATPPQRRILGPVYLVTVAGLVTVIATNAAFVVSDRAGQVAGVVTVTLFGLVPIAFLVGLLRAHLARGSVAGLLARFDEHGSLREALADALGDPSLAIVYPLDSRWVDEAGRDADRVVHRPATILTPVEAEGEVVAGLVHDASLAYDPALLEGVAGAASLALRAQGLQAETHAQFAFLRTLVETAPSLFIHIGTDGRIRNQNAAAVEAAGYEDEELVRGRFFWDVFIAPEEREEVQERFAALAPDYTPGEYENEFANVRGERRVIYWRSAPVHTDDGLVAGIISGGIDITERRGRELELQLERDATTTVLESIQSLVVVLDREGAIRDRSADNSRAAVNRAFRDALGWRDEELAYRPFTDLVVHEDTAPAENAIATAAAGMPSAEVESTLRRADGGSLVLSWTAVPVADVTGRKDFLVLLSGDDITERRAREREDERRRAFMETITEAIPSFLLVLRADGRIREGGTNAAFQATFGWTDSEIVGRPLVGTVVPRADRAAGLTIARAAAGDVQGEVESRWETKEGDSLIVAWTARPVEDAQGGRIVLVSGVDVTARRIHEEEIRASRARIVSAADEARRRLERDLHDGAQQRLVALSVMLSLAESRLSPTEDGAGEILAEARGELAVALAELRELARGIHPAILTDRGLGPALEALVTRAPLAVSLELAAEPLPRDVEAAAYFVAAEALTNVVKYAHASAASIELRVVDGTAYVSVRDDGRGGADPLRGTGLRGLADRLAALDGRLVIESEPGAGTCVRAEIPVRQGPS